MPISKKKYAPKTKLVRRKRLARKPYQTFVNKSLNPVPQRSIVKMKYSESNVLALVGANAGRYLLRLNSVFDPDVTSGANHKPYGYDTFNALYNRYRVIGCSYTISIDTDVNMQLVTLPSNDVVSTVNASQAKEKPRAKFVLQEAAGAPIKRIHGYCSIPSLVGRTKTQYMSDDRYQALTTANPQEEAILNIFVGGMADQALTTNVTINVMLEYTVEFFDVRSLAVSL